MLATPTALDRFAALVASFPEHTITVPESVFTRIASTQTSQGLISLLRPKQWKAEALYGTNALIVVLDQVQDPGNAGTIVRSAEAFGATGVIFRQGSVRVANPKFLRASAGSIFRLPFLESSSAGAVAGPSDGQTLRLYALHPTAKRTLNEVDLSGPCALVIGSEGAGLSPEFLDLAEPIRIPAERVESLNAAVAGSIALYAAAGQRAAK